MQNVLDDSAVIHAWKPPAVDYFIGYPASSGRLLLSAGGTLVVCTACGLLQPPCEASTVSTPLPALLISLISTRTVGRCLSWARTGGCVLRGNHRRLAEVKRRGVVSVQFRLLVFVVNVAYCCL